VEWVNSGLSLLALVVAYLAYRRSGTVASDDARDRVTARLGEELRTIEQLRQRIERVNRDLGSLDPRVTDKAGVGDVKAIVDTMAQSTAAASKDCVRLQAFVSNARDASRQNIREWSRQLDASASSVARMVIQVVELEDAAKSAIISARIASSMNWALPRF
jgi:hypothetical protein